LIFLRNNYRLKASNKGLEWLPLKVASGHPELKGGKIREEKQLGWNEGFRHPEKISIVNASELIKIKPYGKCGNAHSDIYTPGIAHFLWNCIHNVENIQSP